MLLRRLVPVLLLALPAVAAAQSGFTITGGLSNFDCTNHCDTPCNEFEIEIEGIHPEDVIHTYHNGNYGSPTITLSESGASTIIDYRNPSHPTPVGTIEHFGVSLTQLSAFNVIHVRWMVNGAPATVNGQVPNPVGGGSTPATQPIMPSISGELVADLGGEGVMCTVTNNDPSQGIWVKRRAQVTTGPVSLEALMTNNPVVTTAVQIDAAPFYLSPGDSVSYTSDLVEVEDNQSVVFASEYFQDIFNGGIFNQTHSIGASLGNVMTASIAGPQASCEFLAPIIQEQPASATAADGATVNLRVRADGNDLDTAYQWLREGEPLVDSPMFRGVDTDELSIEEVSSWSEGLYQVRITNACGTTLSQSALVFVTGHNEPPPRVVACPSDFDGVPGVTVGDLFSFLDTWFAQFDGPAPTDGSPSADFNKDTEVLVDDLFGFLDAWFNDFGNCNG